MAYAPRRDFDKGGGRGGEEGGYDVFMKAKGRRKFKRLSFACSELSGYLQKLSVDWTRDQLNTSCYLPHLFPPTVSPSASSNALTSPLVRTKLNHGSHFNEDLYGVLPGGQAQYCFTASTPSNCC